MGNPLTRRPPSPPRLLRSRSGSEKNSVGPTMFTSQRFSSSRARSTSKSRNTSQRFTTANQENQDSSLEFNNKSDGFVRFSRRGTSPGNSPVVTTSKMSKSTATSPSAWALSPGRSLFNNMLPPEKVPVPVVGGERGNKVKGVSGVLKFFKQKKVSPAGEEEYHKFRVLHNRVMQWRFVNAKAEATMSSMTTLAEDRLFHVWLRILNVRSVILENRIEIQRTKHDMKLFRIIHLQMSLLNNWDRIKSKNCEAVSRISRKVLALSNTMPLVEDAKGDVESIYKAMSTATELMGDIVATITNFLSQVEKTLYLLTELTTTLQHQEENLAKMEEIVTFVALLLAWEKSVRVQLIQLVK
ncbi:hypothetical protein M5689_017659 [Euphorbia peplus]|nr:hypothetical protein M5689_017659 [Euphorbia peplus]